VNLQPDEMLSAVVERLLKALSAVGPQTVRQFFAAVLSFDWRAAKANSRDPWIAHVLRREAEALLLPNLPAFLEGK